MKDCRLGVQSGEVAKCPVEEDTLRGPARRGAAWPAAGRQRSPAEPPRWSSAMIIEQIGGPAFVARDPIRHSEASRQNHRQE